MAIKIDEDTLARTKYCEKGFSCLGGDKKYLCKVKYSGTYNTLHINPEFDRDCNYCISSVNFFLCFCPVRNEIYTCYKI
jgi:hypothetical protein